MFLTVSYRHFLSIYYLEVSDLSPDHAERGSLSYISLKKRDLHILFWILLEGKFLFYTIYLFIKLYVLISMDSYILFFRL